MSTVADKAGLDPTLPDVSLTIKDKTYSLVFDFNAIVEAERVTGTNLLDKVLGSIDAKSLRGLLWASLIKAQPNITIEQAGDLITLHNASRIREAIVTAWFGSIEDTDSASGEAQQTPTP